MSNAIDILIRIKNFIFIISLAGAVVILVWLGINLTYSAKARNWSGLSKTLMIVLTGLALLFLANAIPAIVISFIKTPTNP